MGLIYSEVHQMSGWIKLHRGIIDWEWYDDINTSRLFLHLLLIANHKDKNWRGILIKKGQKLTSQIKLADETGLTRQQVRSSLNKLKSTNDITIETSSQSTVITVINWNKYQTQPAEQPTDNQRVTNEQPTDNQRITTNKKVKNEKNEKNEDILFDEFWEIYPKKVDKKPTATKWKSLKITEEVFTQIQKHLSMAYAQTEKQFIPSPKVYLNNEKWTDEVITNNQNVMLENKPGRAFGE